MTRFHSWESYAFQWVKAECEMIQVQPGVYFHPNSPSYGQFWMRKMISFDKVRITNAKYKSDNHFVLQSMHKYQPRIHFLEVYQFRMTHLDVIIIFNFKVSKEIENIQQVINQPIDLSQPGTTSFTFCQTEFIAVTWECDKI